MIRSNFGSMRKGVLGLGSTLAISDGKIMESCRAACEAADVKAIAVRGGNAFTNDICKVSMPRGRAEPLSASFII